MFSRTSRAGRSEQAKLTACRKVSRMYRRGMAKSRRKHVKYNGFRPCRRLQWALLRPAKMAFRTLGGDCVTAELFHFVMIKPTHYDDDGYPIQWVRSAIPSNTLAC